jgi:hypothetical protein
LEKDGSANNRIERDFGLTAPLCSAANPKRFIRSVIGNRFPGQKLEWDAEKMKFSNMLEADALI